METRDFKGVWIPKELWNITEYRLSIAEKCYLGLIGQGFTEKEVDDFMKLGGIKSLSRLKGELYLKKLYTPDAKKYDTPEKAKKFTIENSNKGQICEWCKQECYILHNHHFPKSARQGGTKIVKICPNCHYTFHNVFKAEEVDDEIR